jgi:hypothetical protein
MPTRYLLLVQIVCTLAMTGLIWFVQVVHYPLFARVGAQGFAAYEAEHATRTGWVVGPLMCLELGAAFLFLLPRFRPPLVPAQQAMIGAVLVGVIWLSTALIQVPLHSRLGSGYDPAVIARLVATNWIRTVAWTLRSALVLAWTARLLR